MHGCTTFYVHLLIAQFQWDLIDILGLIKDNKILQVILVNFLKNLLIKNLFNYLISKFF